MRRLAALLTGLLLSWACDARTTTAGVEQLASPAGPASGEPNLMVDAHNRVHMTWIERGADSSSALRYAVLDGDTWSPARTIAQRRDFFVNWADFPSVYATSSGRVIVHWLQRSGTARYAYHAWIAQSTDDGATWSAPRRVHRDSSATEHGFLSFVAADGDSVQAIWLDGRKHGDTAHTREMQLATTRVAPDGGLGAEMLLDQRICDCCQTSAALTSRGAVVVYRDRSPDEVRDIYIVRLTSTGWTTPAAVHHDNWQIAACPVNGPAIAARGDTVAVAWFTAAGDTARVFTALSTDAGATFAAPARVDDGQPIGRVDVELEAGGRILVSWLERRGADDADVRLRSVVPGAEHEKSMVVASSAAARASGFPRLALRGPDVVLAWTNPRDSARVEVGVLRRSDSKP